MQQQTYEVEAENQSQNSSVSAGRRSTQPNRPSSQLTQLQRNRHREGQYVHDVASIVTTVNNNFDQGPSRTMSQENSNERESAEENNNVLVTQHHFPNFDPNIHASNLAR